MHDMETYIPIDQKKLSKSDRSKALSAFVFLVEKHDGSIKARKCAVGSKQRTWEGYKKEDDASPTVATDSVIVTSVIEAHEERDEATLDLPGAYLHAKNDEHIIMPVRTLAQYAPKF